MGQAEVSSRCHREDEIRHQLNHGLSCSPWGIGLSALSIRSRQLKEKLIIDGFQRVAEDFGMSHAP